MAVTVDTATLQREIRKRGMPAGFLDDLMNEIADSRRMYMRCPYTTKSRRLCTTECTAT